MKTFRDLGIKSSHRGFTGDKLKIERILNREITVEDYKIEDSKHFKGKCLHLQIVLRDTRYVLFTSAVTLQEMIQQVGRDDFPFTTTIVKENERYEFT